MHHSEQLINELEQKATVLRRNILTIFKASQKGHVGGTMSLVELITALYFHHLKYDTNNCNNVERDRLILSKAHCCETLYAALVEVGWLPKSCLTSYYSFGSPLQGHADRWCTPGIEYSGGSLGQGLSYAAGIALAEKLHVIMKPPTPNIRKYMPRYIIKYNPTYRVYCILGDGECHEGQVWEAAMFASKYKLDNLIAIVDYNKYCVDGPTTEVMQIEPFVEKWKAFGWWVTEIDGHNMKVILDTLDMTTNLYGDNKPKCIIAHTIKGRGISNWEAAHTHSGKNEEINQGVQEGIKKYGSV